MNRRPIVAANWKMNGALAEARALARGVLERLAGFTAADVVLCPPFTALAEVARVIAGSPVALGAQHLHWERRGAFTGEVSAEMLRDVGCRFVLVGHSERRSLFGEADATVRRRTEAALETELTPIVCVGEALAEREAGQTDTVLGTQLDRGLGGLGDALAGVVIAYEPVWAIGTGRNATAAQAQSAHSFIRARLGSICGETLAAGIRILYGGSLKPDNAAELCSQPDVDGGLVGGASLDAGSFVEIVRRAAGG
ncbi:MAG TPA: triose-phosphate isomerase [Candidatus Polarisedimenticolaceae bacterium]|nr:triose-phosphate isomerase [Candidatus Polarisedimenticolaceae bacterium]